LLVVSVDARWWLNLGTGKTWRDRKLLRWHVKALPCKRD
jgi:hypothetical protein